MPLVTCPDCGKMVSDQASTCPGCGRPMGRQSAATAGKVTLPGRRGIVFGAVDPQLDTAGRAGAEATRPLPLRWFRFWYLVYLPIAVLVQLGEALGPEPAMAKVVSVASAVLIVIIAIGLGKRRTLGVLPQPGDGSFLVHCVATARSTQGLPSFVESNRVLGGVPHRRRFVNAHLVSA